MLTCFTVYIMIGIIGYFIFMDRDVMNGNILDNFHGNDHLVSSAKCCIYVVVVFSYPVVNYAGREALINMIGKQDSTIIWYATTILMCGLSYVIGIAVPNILTIINLTITICGILSALYQNCKSSEVSQLLSENTLPITLIIGRCFPMEVKNPIHICCVCKDNWN